MVSRLLALYRGLTLTLEPLLPAHNPHHSLTPPSLLTPLLNNDVQRLHLSFVAGKWDFGKGMSEVPGEPGRSRSLAVWPLHPEVGGSGAEMRVWFADSNGTE